MAKIAIIGTSGLFPGSSTSEEFWDNLMQGRDLTGLATEEDFGVDPKIFFQPGKGVVDKCYSLRGGYIRGFEFDPSGYELPPELLARQDKLYQWPLYVAREALQEAGYFNDKESLERCGLILGNLSFPTGSSHRLLVPAFIPKLWGRRCRSSFGAKSSISLLQRKTSRRIPSSTGRSRDGKRSAGAGRRPLHPRCRLRHFSLRHQAGTATNCSPARPI
ncbi:MAG: hypothetical protein H6560_28855 [Lewinellaceae bacterium]|nr:hypothetical protein [Lewinellaceae bacterium]